MKKNRRSLKRSINYSLFILLNLLIISLICYHFFNKYRNSLGEKTIQYNEIHRNVNELEITVNELERIKIVYLSYPDEDLLDQYKGLKSTYNKITILSAVNKYNEDLLPSARNLISKIDLLFESHENNIAGNHEEIAEDIEKFYADVTSYHVTVTDQLNDRITVFQWWSLLLTVIIFVYFVYFMVRMYYLVIKPIMLSQQVLTEINNGNEKLRLVYKYKNEVADLINSLNRYIDLSQNSFKLIEDQYNRLKLYSDIGEINYVEYSYEDKIIKINYSKKFVEKYNLKSHMITYTVKEFASLVHPNDREAFFKQLEQINVYKDKDYQLDYRIKYPEADKYCYVSTIGKINCDKGDYFMGVQFDITYLKDIQNQLQEQEEQYRLILENSSDLIGKISADGKILYASRAYKETFGDNKEYIDDFNHMVKWANSDWFTSLFKPPYTSHEEILVSTPDGDKWISWNNDAILNENNEVEYIISVGHNITELKRYNDKLKYDSEHDMLTDLLNRRGLFDRLKHLRDINSLAAFFIDLDNFKNINDLYGHEFGDKIIQLFAKDLMAFKEHGCIISRLSGDEFLVLVPNFTDEDSLKFFKNYLNKHVNNIYRVEGIDIYITTSIGYALYPEDTSDFDKLISYADIAMYECKINHLNRCLRFSKEMYEVVNKKVGIANDLKVAIDKDEFEIYYQEIVNVNTNNVDYLESLVRWHSSKGIIMPGDFIPIAEESGFILSLDLLLIEKSFKQFSQLKKTKKYADTKLSFNVSPSFLLRNNFVSHINNLAKKCQLKNQDICIEINENTFVNNIEICRNQIKSLREYGFIVALDDFGREYSSLSILSRVDFDIIKLDRLFINNLDLKLNIEIINMVNRIANLTNNLVIVEGVETEEQAKLLRKMGCFLMQGFLFSKPSKINIEELLVSEKY